MSSDEIRAYGDGSESVAFADFHLTLVATPRLEGCRGYCS